MLCLALLPSKATICRGIAEFFLLLRDWIAAREENQVDRSDDERYYNGEPYCRHYVADYLDIADILERKRARDAEEQDRPEVEAVQQCAVCRARSVIISDSRGISAAERGSEVL